VIEKVTRQADPKVKGNLHIHARNESERQIIGDLKQLANQDGIELTDLVMEGILYMFKAHHWPPGNPQLRLSVFQQEKLSATDIEKCKCGRPAIIWTTHLASKEAHQFCKTCFSNVPLRFDTKIWKITKDIKKPI
jgi:hypothetical protein